MCERVSKFKPDHAAHVARMNRAGGSLSLKVDGGPWHIEHDVIAVSGERSLCLKESRALLLKESQFVDEILSDESVTRLVAI